MKKTKHQLKQLIEYTYCAKSSFLAQRLAENASDLAEKAIAP